MGDAVLLTGATGFVGSAVHERLRGDGLALRTAARGAGSRMPDGSEVDFSGELGPETDWAPALDGCGVVVHSGGRAHITKEAAGDPLREFRRVNVEGTLRLARQAADAGVRRFIFLSSIKVNGEGTERGRPFDAESAPAPDGAYGISKHEAEVGLREIAAGSSMDVAIIRPVLVYGPGVKANFRALMGLLRRRIPLPLGAVDNRRSLVGLGNLADLIATCIAHPSAANQTFLVSDDDDVSTTELLRGLGLALGSPARLIPVPGRWMEAVAVAAGRRDLARRLLGSLQVDIRKTREVLGWTPPFSVDEGLAATAAHYLQEERE